MKLEIRKNVLHIVNDVITYSFILLFLYAGLIKVVDVNLFQSQMRQSPLIPYHIIPALSYGLPFTEIVISSLLVFDSTRKIALYMCFTVMLMFTIYLVSLVVLYTKIPCACGGILGNLDYSSHIIFNIAFTFLAALGIVIIDTSENHVSSGNLSRKNPLT